MTGAHVAELPGDAVDEHEHGSPEPVGAVGDVVAVDGYELNVHEADESTLDGLPGSPAVESPPMAARVPKVAPESAAGRTRSFVGCADRPGSR